ncbi:MAG: calcium-translocating P-type ATPase, PMCA-type [Clostridia bacterium]|nr:calcium-translocating P-type ATPase, PMCA-type [Clostridia bacterium]
MWYAKDIREVERNLKTNIRQGLNEKEAEKRKEQFGENKLADKKKESIIIKFLKQFNDFMIIILIIASIISAIVAKLDGSGDYIDSIIIIAIVIFNSIMGLVQEAKAEKSLEALKSMTAPVSKVKRNGRIVAIKGTNVVPGDIICLEAGNYVPADARLISCSNLKVEESSLTGETVPILKDANAILKKEVAIGDTINMVFSSTIVVNGHGEAIVTETGMNTKVGKIAKMMINDEAPQTPIQKKLAEVGKTLGIGCLIICVLIFIIGLFKKISPIEMFMTSVGLAVAAIPEGLPAIVTIMLSIGVTKMAKKNSIIRKLPAVETLGSSSVICSDKTGTLTQNKMKVVELVTNRENATEKEQEFLLELGSMCTDANIEIENGIKAATGEPTEIAIVNKALEKNIDKEGLYQKMERIKDIPFDSTRKMMSTIHKNMGMYRIITKGAPDVIISKCSKVKDGNNIIEMNDVTKRKIELLNNKMADKALRVIAVAYKEEKNIPNKIDTNTIENNLIFVGLIGMVDPPREGVKEAVETCRKAGIKTVMITGDHIVTAKAIAKELGILKMNDLAITGKELDSISEEQLSKNIMKYSVFARVSPEHKVRIVKAFRKTGAVVAMTGDGVNDAPALKNADIGIAMGLNGTDVAKNAADMVLADDNFITIVEAVKEGRTIFDNIKKAIHFLIATNIGEIVTIFMGLVLGLKSPLLAIQLLWINLVTDSLPAIALGLEKPDKDIMNKKPRDSKKGIFADGLWNQIFVEGIMLGMLTLVAFSLGNSMFGLEVGRTMAFVSLGMLELIHSFNIKSEKSIFESGFFDNKYLIGALILGTIMQVAVVVIPQVAEVFKLVPLNKIQWLYTFLISISPLIIMEAQKKLNEIKFGKVVYKKFEKI